MCWDCFKQYADAPVVNERVVAAYRLILAGKDGDDPTALYHILVDDMNVDDCYFDGTFNGDDGIRRSYDEAPAAVRAVFDALAALTEEERATAVAMEWGYISPSGELREDLR